MTFQEFQRGLIALGYDLGRAGADGVPGRMTQAATIKFKESVGLTSTPLIGPKTVSAMKSALAATRNAKAPPAHPSEVPPPVWMIEAARYLNVREVSGKGSNPTILAWAKSLGSRVLGISYTDDDIPWCGLFVAQCIAATLPKEALPAIVVRASSWDKFGVPASLGLGAVLRFGRQGGGHVGFYAGETRDGRLLRVLGGNQSNRVSYAMLERDRLVSIRWPTTGGTPRPRVFVDARGAVISRNEA